MQSRLQGSRTATASLLAATLSLFAVCKA